MSEAERENRRAMARWALENAQAMCEESEQSLREAQEELRKSQEYLAKCWEACCCV